MKTDFELKEIIDNSLAELACKSYAAQEGVLLKASLSHYDKYKSDETQKVKRLIFRNKVKRTFKTLSKRIPNVLAILFVVVFAFSACAVSSPELMRNLGKLILEKYPTHTMIGTEGDYINKDYFEEDFFFPADIISGYGLIEFKLTNGGYTAYFYNENLALDLYFSSSNANTTIMLDTENADEYEEKDWNGGKYIYVKKADFSACVFFKDTIFYTLNGYFSNLEAQKVMKSLQKKNF